MTERNRLIALLLVLAIIFAMLFSFCFIIEEADHDCSGENCPICYQINLCLNTLKSERQDVIVVAIASLFVLITVILPSFEKKPVHNTSLVTLKVQLSN